METFKKYLSTIGLGLIAIVAAMLGLKLRRLKQLEAEKKVTDMEKDVQSLRDAVRNHREDADAKSKELQRLEAEYRQARRDADAAKSDKPS